MAPKVTPMSEDFEFVNVLYYGRGGVGKSSHAAHAALEGRIVYIDAESGVKKRPLNRLGVPTDNIMRYHVENYEDLDELYWSVKGMLDKDPDSVKCVVFDSVTELQKKLIEDIATKRFDKKRAAGMVDDPFEVDRDEWGKMTEQMRRICRRFRDLPCHTAFVCLEKRMVDSSGAYYRPALTPAFASDLVGYVDIVVYTDVAQAEGETDTEKRARFIGVTVPTGALRGKDRFGILPPVMAYPSMDRIVAYVNQEGEDMIDSDPYQQAHAARMAASQPAPASNEQITTDETD